MINSPTGLSQWAFLIELDDIESAFHRLSVIRGYIFEIPKKNYKSFVSLHRFKKIYQFVMIQK